MRVERFAPSPTGLLHLGHGYSALTAFEQVNANGGRFLLRIEDIDTSRCKPEFEDAILSDLEWLGLQWEAPVMRQSERMKFYQQATDKLVEMGLCYPCGCTRKDIISALSARQEDTGEHPVYSGTCRHRDMGSAGPADAIRLNMAAAVHHLGGPDAVARLFYTETGIAGAGRVHLSSQTLTDQTGDVVLARRDIRTSYHMAVVVDDAAQGITHITRGRDMISETPVHRLLQALLDLPTPVYHHHGLIRDETGKRLAKRYDAMALSHYRRQGLKPHDIMVLCEESFRQWGP